MKKFNVADVLFISGAALLSYGAGLVYFPAGLMVGGLFLISASLCVARAEMSGVKK